MASSHTQVATLQRFSQIFDVKGALFVSLDAELAVLDRLASYYIYRREQ